MRGEGNKRVTMRKRCRGRIIQLKQQHYEPKPDNYEALPVSLLGTGVVRRLVYSPKQEAEELLRKVRDRTFGFVVFFE